MAPNRYQEEESYDFDPRLAREKSTPSLPSLAKGGISATAPGRVYTLHGKPSQENSHI
jgi:hypothetical protein